MEVLMFAVEVVQNVGLAIFGGIIGAVIGLAGCLGLGYIADGLGLLN